MSYTLSNKEKIRVYYDKSMPKSCCTAIKFFINDFRCLSFNTITTSNRKEANLVLELSNFNSLEGYKISISEKGIKITGNDDLGLIFGLFTFLEKFLNIPPFYKLSHIKLEKINSISLENCELTEAPKTRFRGWFINDEDLLGSFKSKGTRRIDYHYYNKIISPKMMEIICETALRHKINLIIPSTFIDVMGKHEYNLVKICSDMGLYISQHHIEPLGVSKFAVANYINDHKLGCTDYSYVSNKENLVKVWEAYCKKWADFPRVIWQLGLRSGLDRPVWDSDKNVGSTPEERGALISDAINTEYQTIKKYYPHEIISTSTLWMEGADLYKTGHLTLPKDTIIVLSDVGMSSLFGDDFFNIKRSSEHKYGFYYHAAFFHTGPHLAEGLLPEKVEYSFNVARKFNNDFYTILNVANVKDLLFSIYVDSKFAFYSEVKLQDVYNQYARFFTKNEYTKLASIIKNYYSSLGDIGENYYKVFCEKHNFSYHRYEDINFPVVNFNDGIFRSIQLTWSFDERCEAKTEEFYKMCVDCENKMANTNKAFIDLKNLINQNYLDEYKQHWIFQSEYIKLCYETLINLYNSTESYEKKDKESFKKYYCSAINCVDEIFKIRKTYFRKYYKNWFKDDTKINLPIIKTNLLSELDDLMKK